MKCFLANDRLVFWCPGCNDIMQVCPKRWNWNNDINSPTLSPSILQTCGPYGPLSKREGQSDICHCFVKNGKIEFLNDCTHNQRGIMDLPDIESVITLHVEPDGRIWWIRHGDTNKFS